MGAFDIAVIVAVSVAVAAVTGWLIYRKVKHTGGCCDCGCSGCTLCDKCNREEK